MNPVLILSLGGGLALIAWGSFVFIGVQMKVKRPEFTSRRAVTTIRSAAITITFAVVLLLLVALAAYWFRDVIFPFPVP